MSVRMIVEQWLPSFGAVREPLPLLGALALGAGGSAIVLSTLYLGGGIPAHRLELMHHRTSVRGAPVQAPAVGGEASGGWHAFGLSTEEQRQVLRSLAGITSAGGALLLFGALRFLLASGAAALAIWVVPGISPMLPILIAVLLAFAGWRLPVLAIRTRLKRHRRSVGAGLPDALELLAICVGAGLSLESALQRVAQEVKLSRPALADELALTWAEMSISPSRDRALANLAERVNLPAVRSLIGTLSQSLRFGTPLAQSLRNAASEMRTRQLTELEERANRLPAMLTIPVMLFIMPTIFLIVGGPAALKLLDLFGQMPR
jgi:tight adherence protein C